MGNWFASPAALWLGLLIGPLLLLYMLRHKPVRKRVPTIMLWEGVAKAQIGTSPFQRLRRSVSLLLMLLALIALVLALSGFRIPGGETRGVSVALVIDTTASMGADARGGTRLDAAKERAREIIDAAGASDVSVMAWDGNLRALTTGFVEPVVALNKLDDITLAQHGASDAALVRAMERLAENTDQRLALITDHPPGALSGDVFVAQSGTPTVNAGIVSASLSEITAQQIDLFFGLELSGADTAMKVPFRLERVLPDGQTELADARDVTLLPDQRASVSFPGLQPGLYAGRLNFKDGFDLDNVAWLRFSELPVQDVVLTPDTPPSVTEAAQAIADTMGLIRLIEPGREDPDNTSYVLSDSASSGARPRLPSAYLAPHASPPGVEFGELRDIPGGATRPSSMFLWRGAGTPDIRLPRIHEMETDLYLRPTLLAGEGAAISLLPRENGLTDLVIAAPLDEDAAGFTGKFAFVIFWANWFDYVRRAREPLARGAVSTRDTVSARPLVGRGDFEYGPGEANELEQVSPGQALSFRDVGVYQFRGLDDTDLPMLGVSLLDAGESNLDTGKAEYDPDAMITWINKFEGEGESRDLELRPWLALLAAALLLVEWFWFRRRFPLNGDGGS